MSLSISDTAPTFTLPRDGGSLVNLTDYTGRWVVLYFYPRDDTPGCTAEGIEFTALGADYAAANAVVLGVSKDTVAKHEKFRDKHGLGVVLLSDAEGSVCEDYGVWVEKNMYGRKSMGIERATYLIDPEGKVAQVWRKVKAKGHAEAVLEALREVSA